MWAERGRWREERRGINQINRVHVWWTWCFAEGKAARSRGYQPGEGSCLGTWAYFGRHLLGLYELANVFCFLKRSHPKWTESDRWMVRQDLGLITYLYDRISTDLKLLSPYLTVVDRSPHTGFSLGFRSHLSHPCLTPTHSRYAAPSSWLE